MTTTSRYKFLGGFPLLVLVNVLWLSITWKVVKKVIILLADGHLKGQGSDLGIAAVVIGLQLLFLFFLMKECRYIKIDEEKIRYINPLLPFIRKTRYFHQYDDKYLVREYSRDGYYEVVWLVKNGKLKDRISSFYYANYDALKNNIMVEHRGMLNINEFKQVACLFGRKV